MNGKPSQGTPAERKTQSIKGKCWNPVKGHFSERKTQSREPSEGKTQSRESEWKTQKRENPVKGHPSEGKTQSRDTAVNGKPSQGTPGERKTQSRESAVTQSRDTQRREITAKGKFRLKEKLGFKSQKSLVYRIGKIKLIKRFKTPKSLS